MPDSPAEKRPMMVIEAANAFLASGQPEDAIELLLGSYRTWPKVPPAYDGMIGRCLLRAGRSNEAITYLILAQTNFKSVPTWLHVSLGTALLTVGRVEEAGHAFGAALDAGHSIHTLAKLIAVEEARPSCRNGHIIDYRFVSGMCFADLNRNVQYCAIPKNACTILKATFVINSDLRQEYLDSGNSIHTFFNSVSCAFNRDVVIEADPARIVVLRDPLSRLVSCYINKFVRPREADPAMAPIVERVIKHVRARRDDRLHPSAEITFEEFANYVASISDAQCDLHWMPQSRICGTDLSIYTHVGRCERLGDTLDYLVDRFAMEPVTDITGHIPFSHMHVTKYDLNCSLTRPWTRLPGEFSNESGYPVPEAFYDDRLRSAVLERYAADSALHGCA